MEIEFMERAFRRRRRKRPLVLREDFCGTAYTACHWVRSHPERRAIGLDLDEGTLEWAKRHNVAALSKEAAPRIDLRRKDVRAVTRPLADILCAFNFSYYLFTPLRELTAYFRKARRSLIPGGIIVLDSYGGWESQQIKREPREVKVPEGRFKYVWEQADYNPVDNMALCHIHFEFPDGGRWEKAFTYYWRLYTPAEASDALLDAGFRNVEVYWDLAEDDDSSDYHPTRRGSNCPGWLAYIVAESP